MTDAFLPLIHTDARGVARSLGELPSWLARRSCSACGCSLPRGVSRAMLTGPFRILLKQLKLLSVHVLLLCTTGKTQQTNVIRQGLWSGLQHIRQTVETVFHVYPLFL